MCYRSNSKNFFLKDFLFFPAEKFWQNFLVPGNPAEIFSEAGCTPQNFHVNETKYTLKKERLD